MEYESEISHMLLLFKYNLQSTVLAEGRQFAKLCAERFLPTPALAGICAC